jgi:myo-inositol 2-dehydrogenase/D-chiro-inositol 1-dehydrogenase
MTVKFAILGAGRIGRVHASAVASVPGARLVAIADPVQAAAEAVSTAYGCDIRSIDAIAASTDVDAVVICTPTDTHADLIERFVRAGKAVFCEKPVDLSLARVAACLKVVEAENGTLMVGFNRRFDPDFMALKAAIDAGRIGAVEMVTIISRDPGAPPADYITRSGGIFRDMTIHDFDMARWLLGEEVDSVMAQASVLTDPAIAALGDYDSVNVILRTASGKQAIITNSRRATAAVLIETLSAPALSKRRISSTVRTPPPTVTGMKHLCAVRSTISKIVSRFSWLAEMSRKHSSSAPAAS